MNRVQEGLATLAILEELRGMIDAEEVVMYYAATISDAQRAVYAERYQEVGPDIANEIFEDYVLSKKHGRQ